MAGLDVHAHRKRTAKQIAWKPLAAQVQAGNVYIVTGPRDRPPLWDFSDFIRELDALAGSKEQDERKLKDQADAASGAWNVLTSTIMAQQRELLCSGDDDLEGDTRGVRRPLSDQEIDDLPDDVASALRDIREHDRRSGRGVDFDDDRFPER